MASENSSDCVSTNGELLIDDSEDSLISIHSQNNCAAAESVISLVEISQDSNLETPIEIVDLDSRDGAESVKIDDSSSTDVEIISEDVKESETSNLEDRVKITNSQDSVTVVGSDAVDLPGVELQTPTIQPSHTQDSLQQIINLNPTKDVTVEEKVNANTPKLVDLEHEVERLRVENEQLSIKLTESKSKAEEEDNEADISIRFRDRTFYDLHRDKFTRLFDTLIDYCVSSDDTKLQITIIKDDHIDPDEWILVEGGGEEAKEVSGSKKRKKRNRERDNKKKAKKETPSPEKVEFVLDTTPSLNAESNLKYESKFSVIAEEKPEEKADNMKANFNSCFNCGEEHNLRDCPHPKNMAKINAARQKFKRDQPPRNVRYHIENDAFTHLKPGKISHKLRDAMHLRDDELPEYIYRMRRLGYPPGWMKEISQNESDLVVFDFDGKTETKRKKPVEFDADLIIEYTGFNMPMGKYIRDDHKYYQCPSFSRHQGKNKMLEELNKNKKAAMDNLDACDMDLDTSFDDEQEKEIKCVSPTLLALESEKKKILDQLSVDNPSQNVVKVDEHNNSQESIDDCFKTIDKVGELDSETDVSMVELVNHITLSSFGTPLIESASPYSKLPNTENFAKNVSQVLIFENLPESTGKFDQLSGILSKVRKTMKDSNSKSS